jgi:hypothetical protein
MATAVGVARECGRRMIEHQPDTTGAAQTGLRRDPQLHGKDRLRRRHGEQDRVVVREGAGSSGSGRGDDAALVRVPRYQP